MPSELQLRLLRMSEEVEHAVEDGRDAPSHCQVPTQTLPISTYSNASDDKIDASNSLTQTSLHRVRPRSIHAHENATKNFPPSDLPTVPPLSCTSTPKSFPLHHVGLRTVDSNAQTPQPSHSQLQVTSLAATANLVPCTPVPEQRLIDFTSQCLLDFVIFEWGRQIVTICAYRFIV